jgi:hypothetical protein
MRREPSTVRPTRLELELEEGLVVVEHLDGDAVPVP